MKEDIDSLKSEIINMADDRSARLEQENKIVVNIHELEENNRSLETTTKLKNIELERQTRVISSLEREMV